MAHFLTLLTVELRIKSNLELAAPTFSRRLRSSERSLETSSSASSYQRLTVFRMSIVSDLALKIVFCVDFD